MGRSDIGLESVGGVGSLDALFVAGRNGSAEQRRLESLWHLGRLGA